MTAKCERSAAEQSAAKQTKVGQKKKKKKKNTPYFSRVTQTQNTHTHTHGAYTYIDRPLWQASMLNSALATATPTSPHTQRKSDREREGGRETAWHKPQRPSGVRDGTLTFLEHCAAGKV